MVSTDRRSAESGSAGSGRNVNEQQAQRLKSARSGRFETTHRSRACRRGFGRRPAVDRGRQDGETVAAPSEVVQRPNGIEHDLRGPCLQAEVEHRVYLIDDRAFDLLVRASQKANSKVQDIAAWLVAQADEDAWVIVNGKRRTGRLPNPEG